MANLSEDIQCAGSDTRPPMLDKADFASWQQRIRLYCRGSLNLGPEPPRVYADLTQHEAHANENKMMLERLTQQTVDPLALMSNVSPQHYHSQSSTNPPTTYHQPHSADTSQSDLGLSPTDNLIENLTNTLALLTQSYKTFLPQTNNQLRTSSNPRNQATVQDGRVVVQNVQVQLVMGEHRTEWGMLIRVKLGRIENRVVLDEEQLLFLAGGQDNAIDEDVDEHPVQDLALNVDNVFQADDCDAYDSDVDEAHDHYQDAVCDHHEEHEMHDDVRPNHVVDSHADYTSDTHRENGVVLGRDAVIVYLDCCGTGSMLLDKIGVRSYYDEVNKVAIGYKNPLCLHRARQVQPALYSGHVIVTPNHAPAVVRDGEETLELTEISRKKMHDKMKANEL
ncbi:hypothetical protein Tco_1474995 [Tanacetum coccineum]